MELTIRKFYTFIEQVCPPPDQSAESPLRKVAAVAIVQNPCAGRYVEDLNEMIQSSVALGGKLSQMAVEALCPYTAQSYGKAGIVGLAGEQEHANALLTSVSVEPLRAAIGGGKAWIPSFTKRAGPGATIDIPLASKDALYVRSHYDGMTITLPDSPHQDEVAIIFCLANRGRINARVGGLTLEEMKGLDGLV
jgi:hypothetical protein